MHDLENWETLYISGRLHKPVKIIQTTHISELSTSESGNGDILNKALKSNLRSAMHSALLLLPEYFTDIDLYRCISNLSYMGDVRMLFAENPNKVNNIVSNNLEHFHHLYANYVGDAPSADVQFHGKISKLKTQNEILQFRQCLDSDTRQKMWVDHPLSDELPNWDEVGRDIQMQRRVLSATLASVVSKSSRAQSLLGIISAGPKAALLYGMRKVGKRFFTF